MLLVPGEKIFSVKILIITIIFQSVSCLCMTGIPMLLNKAEFNSDIYGSRSPSVRNHDGLAISRLPTYSQHRLGDARHQRQLSYSDPGYDQVTTGVPRILFPTTPASSSHPGVPMLRECWPNPYQAESPGCSVQKYRGHWYNICRYDH